MLKRLEKPTDPTSRFSLCDVNSFARSQMVRLSIGEAIGLDHLDQEEASERMVYFKMSVGRHVKRSRTVSTGKSDAGAWNQTFCFPIFIHENPEIIIVGEECHR